MEKYTKLDSQGNALPDTATSWTMVMDNVTGLMWEMKTDDGSIHDKGKKYTWAQARSVFIARLNTASFGGFSDWRLPTVEELSFIVDNGRYDPAVNPAYFPNTRPSFYWSATPDAVSTNSAWCMAFGNGRGYSGYKSSGYNVRAVRGGQKEGQEVL